MYLVTAEEMRAFDATAINDFGIPGVVLMENAGRATFDLIRRVLGGSVNDRKVVIVAGPGNNGGDGYVIARCLLNHGAHVSVFLLAHRERIGGDALINLQILEKMTTEVFSAVEPYSLADASGVWNEADAIVDAMLGTGLSEDLRAPYREAVERVNAAPGVKIAVDVPSGLDSNTGKILGAAVRADYTATYGFMKLGMAIEPGKSLCGVIETVDIGIPFEAVCRNPPKAELYDGRVPLEFKNLRQDTRAHKGTFGHVAVIGGSPGKTGAPVMAAIAASRMGAGLVTVGVPASLNPILEAKLTEEMTMPLPDGDTPGFLGPNALDAALELCEGKRCVVLGPGLSTAEGTALFVSGLLSRLKGKAVIDADALNLIGEDVSVLEGVEAELALTPHPGEMARLTGLTTRDVQADRIGTARSFATQRRAHVTLKGAGTICASPDGRVIVNPTGNPWMASGGQGDVLSGMVGGLVAQGVPIGEAAPFAVWVHGLAADGIVARRGQAPVLACDSLNELAPLLGNIV
jgi:NAD(P)H-hydrate epimerase